LLCFTIIDRKIIFALKKAYKLNAKLMDKAFIFEGAKDSSKAAAEAYG
jgi:hypothetical protein